MTDHVQRPIMAWVTITHCQVIHTFFYLMCGDLRGKQSHKFVQQSITNGTEVPTVKNCFCPDRTSAALTGYVLSVTHKVEQFRFIFIFP